MFARVTTAYISINKIDDTISIVQENIIPAAKSQKGFRGFYGLSDRKTGKGITISLWDTEEDAPVVWGEAGLLTGGWLRPPEVKRELRELDAQFIG